MDGSTNPGKIRRKEHKYAHMLEKDTGIKVAYHSKFVMICNAGLASGVCESHLREVMSFIPERFVMQMDKTYSFAVFNSADEAEAAIFSMHTKLYVPKIRGPLYLLPIERIPFEYEIHEVKYPNGLHIIQNFITEMEENFLMDTVVMSIRNKTQILKNRRVKHFGYEFDYSLNKAIVPTEKIPEEFDFLTKNFQRIDGVPEHWFPDQLTINMYEPGQGIPRHIDTHSAFEGPILSLSLGSDVFMDFSKMNEKSVSVLLPARSLLVMSGEARLCWNHGIAVRKWDYFRGGIRKRGERVSFTFRRIRRDDCKCIYKEYCNSQKLRS